MTSPRISILVHREHGFSGRGYLLDDISAIWRERGIDVAVLHGPAETDSSDAVILHVDATIVPAPYMRFVERHPVAINGRVADISKRIVSRNIVTERDDWTGPVIVKTDANCGGMMAAGLRRTTRYADAVASRIPFSWSKRTTLRSYRIFDSLTKVPRGVWINPNLIVERFLAERRNELYCLRTWLFFGDQERIAIFYSNSPVVKSVNIIGRDVITEVPDDLRAMRRELGFDFGKFDFTVVDGKTVLFDANRTPTIGAIPKEQYRPWLGKLADGIHPFLNRAS